MRLLLVFTVFTLLSFSGFAQKFVFDGQITDLDTKKRIGGVTVAAFSGGTEILKMTTGNNGKYSMELPIDKNYTVRFTKDGYVIKTMTINAVGILEEDLPIGGQIMPAVDIELFAERPGIDFSFMKTEPVVVWEYNSRKLIMDWDKKVVEDMKEKIDRLLQEAEEKLEKYETEYADLLRDANLLFRDQKYEEALQKYTAAIQIPGKEQEPFPNTKIVEIDDLLAQKEKEELLTQQANQEYQNLITAAENLKQQGDLEKAIARFNEASAKKPEEQYPKDQVQELQRQINLKKNKDEYDALVATADELLSKDQLTEAKTKYEAAKKLLPSETYPDDQIKVIEQRIIEKKEAEEKQKQYNDAIKAADKLFQENQFAPAIEKYKVAQAIDAENEYPQNQIRKAEEKLQEQKEAEKNELRYQSTVQAGDQAFAAKEYDKAIDAYNEALKAKPDAKHPSDRIKEIEAIRAEKAANAEKEQKIETLLAEASKANTEGEYNQAITKYKEVLGIDPANTTAIEGQKEAEKALAAIKELQAQQEKFDNLVKEADNFFDQKNYEKAKEKYLAAEQTIPNNAHVVQRLEETESKLKEALDNAKKTEQISAILNQGKQAENKGELDEAEASFNEVLTMDESNAEAKEGLSRVADKRKELEQAAQEQAQVAQKAQQIAETLAQAKQAEDVDNLNDAESKYNAVLQLDGTNSIAKEGLTRIENKRKEKEQKAQEEANAAAKAEQIESLISKATQAEDNDQLDDAETKYNEVLALESNNQKAKEGLARINSKRSAEELAAKEAEKAAFEQKIATVLEEAKAAEDNEALDEAETKYNEVLTLDAKNSTAKSGLSRIENKRKAIEKAEQEAAKAEEQATKAAEIQSLINAGKTAEENGNLDDAEVNYKNVLKLDASNSKAKSGLASVLAKREELARAENEKLAQEKAQQEAEQAAQAAQEKEQLLAQAESAEEQKDWNKAIETYEAILKDDPSNVPLKAKLDKAKQAQKKEEEQKVQQEYQNLVDEGDKFVEAGDLKSAEEKYKAAKKIKSSADVDLKIEKVQEQVLKQASVAEKEEKFNQLITEADSYFNAENYPQALEKYENALLYKNDDQHARGRIVEINELFLVAFDKGTEAFVKKDYANAIKFFDDALEINPLNSEIQIKRKAAREELDRLLALEEKYTNIMKEADEKFAAEDLTGARKLYVEAQKVKPNESAPQLAIVKIDEALRKKLENEAQADEQVADLLKQADDLAKKGEYQEAVKLVEQAEELKPNPLNASKIKKYKEEEEKQKEEEVYQDLVAKADKAFEDGELEKSKSLYEEAIALKEDPTVRANINKIKKELDKPEEVDETEQVLNEANKAYVNKEYEKAKALYQQVKDKDPSNTIAATKITEIDKAIELEEQKSEQEEQEKKLFEDAVALGDKKKEQGRFLEARDEYEKALELNPASMDVRKKVAEVVQLAQQKADEDVNAQYEKIVNKADDYFDKENYQKSLKLYERALTFRSYDKYPKDRIDEIKRILSGPVKKEVSLEYLGEDEELSVLEAAALLEEAEEKRKAIKKQEITDRQQLDEELRLGLEEKDLANRRTFQDDISTIEKERSKNYLENNIAKGQDLFMSLEDELIALEKLRLQEQGFERGAILRQNESLRFMSDDFTKAQEEASGNNLALADEIDAIQADGLEQQQVRNNSLNDQRKRNTEYMEGLQDDLRVDTERAKIRRDDNQEQLRIIAEEQEEPHDSSEKHLNNAKEIDYIQNVELIAQAEREANADDQQKRNTEYMEDLQDNLQVDTERAKIRRDDNQEQLRLIAEDQEQPHESSKKHLDNADELDAIQLKGLNEQKLRDEEALTERKKNVAEMEALNDQIATDFSQTHDRTSYNHNEITRTQEVLEVPHESSEKHLANADELDEIQLKGLELQQNRDEESESERKAATNYMDGLKDDLQADTERTKLRRDDNQEKIRLIAEEQEIPHESSKKHLDNAAEIDGQNAQFLKEQEDREVQSDEELKANVSYMDDLADDLKADTERAKIRRDDNFEKVTLISEEQEVPHKGSGTHLENADEIDFLQAKGSEMLRDLRDESAEEEKQNTNYMNNLTDELKEDLSRSIEMRNTNDEKVRNLLSDQEMQLVYGAEDSYNKIQYINYQTALAEIKQEEIQEDKKIVQQEIENDLRQLIAISTKSNQDEVEVKKAELLRADAELVGAQNKHKETTEFKDLSREKTVAIVDDISKKSELDRRLEAEKNANKVQGNINQVEDVQKMNEEQLLAMDEDLTELRDLLEDQKIALENKVKARDDQKNNDRQGVVADIEKVKVESEEERTEKEKVAKDNHAVIDVVSAINESEETKRQEALKAQKQRRQELLDGLDSGKFKYTEVIANSLGDEFPEGVSQEMYVKKDKDGLPIQVVTRRIVVFEGKGDVYLRIQTKRGVTYSKNGQPISEQAWLKGTESGKLQRHF